jgi:hypothetical protein
VLATCAIKTRLAQTHTLDAVTPQRAISRTSWFAAINTSEQRITQAAVSNTLATSRTEVVARCCPAAIVTCVHGLAPALAVVECWGEGEGEGAKSPG